MIRQGVASDLESVHRLVVELATYEKEPEAVKTTPAVFRRDFEAGCFEFFVAESEGELVAFCMYYPRYSTWTGRCMYLEDIFVRASHRRAGLGLALFEAVREAARSSGAARLEWQCLDWNQAALAFYKDKVRASSDSSWVNLRLTREQL